MKKIILSFMLFITVGAIAQGNLQFNRVVTFTTGDNYSVPSGKVLKIESISMQSGSICIPRTSTVIKRCSMYIGGYDQPYGIYDSVKYLTIGNFAFGTGGYDEVALTCGGAAINAPCHTMSVSDITGSIKTPLWLEAGKNISIIGYGNFSLLLSAIEFNIVP